MPSLNGLSHTKPSAETSRGLVPEGLASHFGDWTRSSAAATLRAVSAARLAAPSPLPVPSTSGAILLRPAARSSPLRTSAPIRRSGVLLCCCPQLPAASCCYAPRSRMPALQLAATRCALLQRATLLPSAQQDAALRCILLRHAALPQACAAARSNPLRPVASATAAAARHPGQFAWLSSAASRCERAAATRSSHIESRCDPQLPAASCCYTECSASGPLQAPAAPSRPARRHAPRVCTPTRSFPLAPAATTCNATARLCCALQPRAGPSRYARRCCAPRGSDSTPPRGIPRRPAAPRGASRRPAASCSAVMSLTSAAPRSVMLRRISSPAIPRNRPQIPAAPVVREYWHICRRRSLQLSAASCACAEGCTTSALQPPR